MADAEAILSYRSEGLDETLAGAREMNRVSQTLNDNTQKLARSQLSAENSLRQLNRQYEPGYRASEQMANAQAKLNRALQQGLVDATNYDRLNQAIIRTHTQAAEAARARAATNDNMAQSFAGLSREIGVSLPLMDRFTAVAGRFGPLAAGVAVGVGAAAAAAVAIAAAGDEYTKFENQLKSAGVATGVARDTLRDLAAQSIATRTPLEGQVALYARLTRVSADLGVSQGEVRRATDILSKAVAGSGASAQEAAGGLLQLSQALQSGRLNGDELRSVLENMPDVAKAIAAEFKTTVGGLRELGSEGQLTADRVFRAIINAGPAIDESFGKTVPTIEGATTAAKTAFTLLLAEMDRILNLSPAIAATIQKVANVAGSAAQKLATPDFGFERQAREIEQMRTMVARLEASSGGQGDLRLDAAREQLDRLTSAYDRATRAAASFTDSKIDEMVGKAAPPLRIMTDEMERLSREAEDATRTLPGVAGALDGVASAAGQASVQVASVAAGIRALQALNPDFAGVIGYLDKAKQINDTFNATKIRIQQDFGESGNNPEAIRQTTEALESRERALKATLETARKGASEYVRSGELAGMSELDRGLGQNADSFQRALKESQAFYGFLAKQASSPEAAEAIRRQGETEVAKIENARKLLDAKTRADQAKKGSSGSDTDAFDSAMQRSRDQVEEFRAQAEAAGKNAEQVYRLAEANRLRRAAVSAGRDVDADLTRQIEEQADAFARQRKATDDVLEAHRRMQESTRALGDEMSRFFDDVLLGSRGMADAFESAGRSLVSSGLRAVLTGQGPLAGIMGTASTEKGEMGGLLGGQLPNFLRDAVREGAKTGTASGSELGLSNGLGDMFQGVTGKQLLGGAAGLTMIGSSYGLGKQAGSPLMAGVSGAFSGALGGAMLGAQMGAGLGLPVAAIGAGIGCIAHSYPSKENSRERRQRRRLPPPHRLADGFLAVRP